MAKKGVVEHDGVVGRIDGKTVFVNIMAESACLSCKLQSVCSSDTEEKTIEVQNVIEEYQVGDGVKVLISEKLGMKALFYGYLLPFIVVLVGLILGITLTGNEGVGGLISIGSLIPYFIILYFFREKFKKTFQFSLQKRNH